MGIYLEFKLWVMGIQFKMGKWVFNGNLVLFEMKRTWIFI